MSDPLLDTIERAIRDHGCTGTGRSLALAIQATIAPLVRPIKCRTCNDDGLYCPDCNAIRDAEARGYRLARRDAYAICEDKFDVMDGPHGPIPNLAMDIAGQIEALWPPGEDSTQPPAGDEVGEDWRDLWAKWREHMLDTNTQPDNSDCAYGFRNGVEYARAAIQAAESTRANGGE